MATRIGKGLEKRVAKAVGGQRVSAPYRKGPDVTNNWLCIECKARKKLPQWIENALRQAERDAEPRQLPIAVLHEKYRRQGSDLVVMRWRTFQQWFGDDNGDVPEVQE
jgi:hypothetical protein